MSIKVKLKGEDAKKFVRGEHPGFTRRVEINPGEREGNRMANHFIKGAIHRKGALTRKAEAAGEPTQEFARTHLHAPGKTGEEARFDIDVLNKVRPKGHAAHRAAERGARTRRRHANLPRAAAR